jgi:chemotaxis protein CheD
MDQQNVNDIYRLEYFLKPGYIFFSPEPSLIYTVLGSAVTVCLWDREKHYGGAAHFIYPKTSKPQEATTRYGNVAVLTLIRLLTVQGSVRTGLEAQVFGGGDPNHPAKNTLGEENILTAKAVLRRQGIPVSSEDVGGSRGRKLVYKSDTNEAMVLKVDRLRQEDWFPYNKS